MWGGPSVRFQTLAGARKRGVKAPLGDLLNERQRESYAADGLRVIRRNEGEDEGRYEDGGGTAGVI